ncbi:hypothetical protein MPB81_000061 [Listeria monocytogenes]|nr:hypothetical protein [Listeria monocytogenes]
MTKYYTISKGSEAYDYLDKLYNKDTNAFLNEVTELLGFEASGSVGINREKLIIKKSVLEKAKPEWLLMFKKYKDEWMTPKVAFKDLINAYAKLREKYNMDMDFRWFCWTNGALGKVELIHDFDQSGYAYFNSDREIQNSTFVEISEVAYLEREAALLARTIARKKGNENG